MDPMVMVASLDMYTLVLNLVTDTLEPGSQLGNSGPSVLPKVTVDMTTGYGSGAHCTVKTLTVKKLT